MGRRPGARAGAVPSNLLAMLPASLWLALLALGLLKQAHIVAAAATAPQLLSPTDGAVLYCARDGATPSFTWDAGAIPRAVEGLPDTIIELSAAKDFSPDSIFLARDEVPAIIERYVRAAPLELVPQTLRAVYYWRVGRPAAGMRNGSSTVVAWSEVRAIKLRMPGQQTIVPVSETGWAAIQGLLASAAAVSSALQPSLLHFEGGGSRTLTPPPRDGDGGSTPPAFLRLASVTDLIVDGGGSTITFSEYVQFVDLLNCSRVQIVNFAFDLQPLPYTALAVESVDAESSTATLRLQPGHPTVESLLSNKQLETSGIAEVMSTMAPVAGEEPAPRTMRGAPEVIFFSNVTRLPHLGRQAVRYKMLLRWGGVNPLLPQLHGVDRLSAGDFLVIDPRIDIGFDVMGGEHVTLRNVQVFACANECFNSEHAESLAILHCGTMLRPGRFLAANNGGHNHHGSAVGQWVEGGIWENAGDDTIHVSGLVMSVLEIGGSSAAALTLAPSYPDSYSARKPIFHHSLGVRQGDVLQFYDFATGTLLARRQVLTMREATDANPTVGVTLDQPVPASVTPGRISGGPLNHTVTQVYVRRPAICYES